MNDATPTFISTLDSVATPDGNINKTINSNNSPITNSDTAFLNPSTMSGSTLRMPNIGLKNYSGNMMSALNLPDNIIPVRESKEHKSKNRPLTTPVNIYRTPLTNNASVTIPVLSSPGISPVNIPSIPINLPPSPRSINLPPSPRSINLPPSINLPSIPIKLPPSISPSPRTVDYPSLSGIVPSSRLTNIPSVAINLPPSPRFSSINTVKIPVSPPVFKSNTQIPPILRSDNPISMNVINASVNEQINISEDNKPVITSDPLIPRDDLIPIYSRPLSPRDSTKITLHGVAVDRNTIAPIAINDTTDIDTDDDIISRMINCPIQPPVISENNTFNTDITTTDTDVFMRNLLDDSPIINPQFLPHQIITLPDSSQETIITAASPTTQITLSSDSSDNHVKSSISCKGSSTVNNDIIIDAAPPIASININRSFDNNKPVTQAHKLSRGKQPLPSLQQPTIQQSPQSPQSPQQQLQEQPRQQSPQQQQLQEQPRQQSPQQQQLQEQPRQPQISSGGQLTNELSQTHPIKQQNSATNSQLNTNDKSTTNSQQILSSNNEMQRIPPTITDIKSISNNNQRESINRQSIPSSVAQSLATRQNIPPPVTVTPSSATQNIPPPITPSPVVRQNIPPPVTAIPSSVVRQNIPPPVTAIPSSVATQNIPPPVTATQSSTKQNIPPPVTATPSSATPSSATQSSITRQNIPPPVTQSSVTRQNIPQPVTQSSVARQNIPPPVTPSSATKQNVPQPVTATPSSITQSSATRQNVPQTATNQSSVQSVDQPASNETTRLVNVEKNNQQRNLEASSGQDLLQTATTPRDVVNDNEKSAAIVQTLPPLNIPNYSGMTPEEQAQHRANFRTRFGILRNAWPNYHIPDVPDSLPLEQVHAQYDIYVRHIHISQDVDQYKVYLVIMWLLIELFCTKIGLNIGGYTVAQMRSMNKYERLLIELGETNYKNNSAAGGAQQSNWPIEVRIFFMALVNAVTFIIIKMLASYIGEGMATTIVDSLSSYLSGTPPQPGQVLFGGPAPATSSVTTQGPSAGPGPMPQMGNPFGGIDVPSLLSNFGSMFIRGQAPGNAMATAAPAVVSQPAHSQGPSTPRYIPAYDE